MKKYLQAIAIWILIIPLAILNGGFLDLVEQYYFWTGNLWIVVVLSTLFAPIIVFKFKNLGSR